MNERAELITAAKEARNKAYAPYSDFIVGAALKGRSGVIYTGCNIENASFSLTCCAERVAIFKAISEEEVAFDEIAVIADVKGVISPCGACRQVMAEFFSKEVKILLCNLHGQLQETNVQELLPSYFTL